MLDVSFVKPAQPQGGALVVPMAEDGAFGGMAADLDSAAGGALKRAFAAAEFKGRKGQSCTVWAPMPDGQQGPTRIVAVGIGKAAELSAETAEAAGGAALRGEDAVLREVAQDRLEELAGEALGGGEVVARERASGFGGADRSMSGRDTSIFGGRARAMTRRPRRGSGSFSSGIFIVFIAIFADIATLAIAYDNAPYSKSPVKWNLPKLWGMSILLGIALAVGTWITLTTL